MPIIGNPILIGGGGGGGNWPADIPKDALILYSNGYNNGLTATKIYGSTGTYTLTNSNGILTCYDYYSSGNYAISAFYGTQDAIDLTNYDTAVMVLTEVTNQTAQNYYTRFGVPNKMSGDLNGWTWYAKKDFNFAVGTETTFTLDISSVSGANKIGFGMWSGGIGPRAVYTKIKTLYLN